MLFRSGVVDVNGRLFQRNLTAFQACYMNSFGDRESGIVAFEVALGVYPSSGANVSAAPLTVAPWRRAEGAAWCRGWLQLAVAA